jgi:hypothetical protein
LELCWDLLGGVEKIVKNLRLPCTVPGSEPAAFRLSVEFSAVSTSLGLRERTIQTIRKGKVVPVHTVSAYRGAEI